MTHGKSHGKSYCKNKERVRQYSEIIRRKYNNPTLLRLKDKSTQDHGPLKLESVLDLISTYQKTYNVCNKNLKRQIYQDFYDIFTRKVIEVLDTIQNAEPIRQVEGQNL